MSKRTNSADASRVRRHNLLQGIRLTAIERKHQELRLRENLGTNPEANALCENFLRNYNGQAHVLDEFLCEVENKGEDFNTTLVKYDVLAAPLAYIETPDTLLLLLKLANQIAFSVLPTNLNYIVEKGVFDLVVEKTLNYRVQEREFLLHSLLLFCNLTDVSVNIASLVIERLSIAVLLELLNAFRGEVEVESLCVSLLEHLFRAAPERVFREIEDSIATLARFLHRAETTPTVQQLQKDALLLLTDIVEHRLDSPAFCDHVLSNLNAGSLITGLSLPELGFLHEQMLKLIIDFTSLEVPWVAPLFLSHGLDKILMQHTQFGRLRLMIVSNLFLEGAWVVERFLENEDFIPLIVRQGVHGTADEMFEAICIVATLSALHDYTINNKLHNSALPALVQDCLVTKNHRQTDILLWALNNLLNTELGRITLPEYNPEHQKISLLLARLCEEKILKELDTLACEPKLPKELSETASSLHDQMERYARAMEEALEAENISW
jgi:hypothetical protein